MTTTTGTLTDFLLARIAEDEAAARAADESDAWGNPYDDGTGIERTFTPARVLAECEAKRRIVELHPRASVPDRANPVDRILRCPQCRSDGGDGYSTSPWPCRTLLALAAVYADHPDYRQEWRP